MLTRRDNFNFHFSFGGYDFHISNIVLERFERFIPSHSHSKNSYEIHYIPFGNGTAIIMELPTKSLPIPSLSPVRLLSTHKSRLPRTL